MKTWFACLTTEQVREHWQQLAPLMQPAVDKTPEILLSDIRRGVEDKKYFLAVMGTEKRIVLVIVMNLLHYTRMTALNIMLLGGRHTQLMVTRYWHKIREFAKAVGCTHIECRCGDAEARLYRMIRPQEAVVAYNVLRTGV